MPPPPAGEVLPSTRTYRPDIDGLRALAVMSVLTYHAGLTVGGFTGVDIFFVISGYLIGNHVIDDVSRGRFSARTFYERRIRRLAPALIATLLASSLLAWICLLPDELTQYGQSSLSVLGSVSNYWLLSQAGYFGPAAETMPLLHTWSLSVEEQFYIVLPLLMIACARFCNKTALLRIVIACAIVSLALSIAITDSRPDLNFYGLPTRLWEMAIGTLVGAWGWPWLRATWLRNLVSAIGLLLCCYPIFAYNASTPFPGIHAIAPCVGAAMVIAAGQEGRAWPNRMLGIAPIRFIGLISYSLYLVHWPIIVFQQSGALVAIPFAGKVRGLILIAASIIVATASWWFVERPFRRGFRTRGANHVFAAALGAAAVVSAISIVFLATRGLPRRFPPEAVRMASFVKYAPQGQFREGSCFITSNYAFKDFDRTACLKRSDGKPDYLLIGDSHAADLWAGLRQTHPELNILQATASGCRAMIREPAEAPSRCIQLFAYIFDDYLAKQRVDRVLLAGRWTSRDIGAIGETLDALKARRQEVTLIGPAVQYDAPLPRLLAMQLRDRDPHELDGHRLKEAFSVDRTLRELARAKGIAYISLIDAMCQGGTCLSTTASGAPIQFDYGHFTAEGSTIIARRAFGSL